MSDPVYDVDLEIPADLGVNRLDRVLEKLVPGRTKSQLQKLVRKGNVKLDKQRVVRSNVKVRVGQRLREEGGEAPRGGAQSAAPPSRRRDGSRRVVGDVWAF